MSTVEHQKRPAMAVEMVGVMDMVGGIISRIITGVVEPQKHPKVRERSDRVIKGKYITCAMLPQNQRVLFFQFRRWWQSWSKIHHNKCKYK